MTYVHIPVLLNEVVNYLAPKPGQNYVDATLGGGGYSREILSKIGSGKLLSIDLDSEAIEHSRMQKEELGIKNWILAKSNFQNINKIAKEHEFNNISGIVADLGLSSNELDASGRGFSFRKDEPLDMRFDLSQPEDAKFVLNTYDLGRLQKIFEDYGEEKFARQIARKIIDYRLKIKAVSHTSELYNLIVEALPKPVKHKADDSARRIFQALRISVNHELENLAEFLPKSFDLLSPGGRLAVVSFHSLEDRQVKQYFVSLTKGCVCPPDFPQCLCGKNPQGKLLTKKPITASEEELNSNSRSKPAKLRVIEKI